MRTKTCNATANFYCDADGKLSYLLGDHLGSSSVTTDANGAKTASALYKAFGETRYTLGALGTDYKFTGQREQAELGLYFYGARWFDPSLGRFTSPDTIVPTSTQGTQAWDRYAYVNNNPVRYNDPTGHSTECGIGEEYCEAGELDTQQRAYDTAANMVASHPNLTYYGVEHSYPEEASILVEGGVTAGHYEDLRSGGVSPADALHDPATYIVTAVGTGGVVRAGWRALVTFATINAEASITSIGSNGLYQRAGYTYFRLPDPLYKLVGPSVNKAVITSQIALGKPAVVSLLNPSKPGAGTLMEMAMYKTAGYVNTTANFLGFNNILQPPTWIWPK